MVEFKENKITIQLAGTDRLEYYDYDDKTMEAKEGLIENLQKLLGKDFKCSITGRPTGEITEDIYLTIGKI